jgi:isoleucyl-tRNA synthetase
LVAPLLAFTAEEVWGYTAKPSGAPETVHAALLPEPAELTSGLDAAKLAAWDELMSAREKVLKALEESRQTKFIGTSLEARVRISGGPPVLETYAADLSSLFIVSQVFLEAGDGEMKVAVERADGVKCERCWKYSTKVGEDAKYPTVCDTCAAALREMLG